MSVTAAAAPAWPQLELRLQAHVFQCGIRLQDFFVPYDRHRRGLLTRDNFHRALLAALIPVSPADVDVLARQFTATYKNQPMIDYKRFVDAVNAVLGPRDLERHPEGPILEGADRIRQFAKVVAAERRQPGNLDAHQQGVIRRALKQVCDRVVRRRLDLKPVFRDFDKFNSGCVTRTQFEKCLTASGFMFSEEAVRLLQRTYASSGHQEDVGYVEFLADVARLAKYDGSDATVPPVVPCKPSSSAPSSSSAPPSKTSLDDLIYLLRVNSFAKGVRLFRFLRDADPLRRNCMTRTRFGAIVSSIANVNLTDAQLNTLQQAFPHAKEPDQIDYQRLHDAIEAAGHVKDLEMQPLSAPRRFTIVPAVPDVAPDEPIRSALESVCRFLTERNVTLVSFFKDFDRVNSGTISHAQFRSVLTSLDARVSKADENALLSRFTTPANRFNYRAFDKAVQLVLDERRRPHDQEQHLQASLVPIVAADDDLSEDAPHSARRDGGRVTYGKALHRLQTYLQGNGVRIVDLFTDFDQLRTGRVLRETFARVLRMTGFGCSPEEIDLLAAPFLAPVHPDYAGAVHWKRFVRAVTGAFAEIDPDDPTRPTVPFVPYRDEGSDESLRETQQDTAAIDAILARLYETATRFGMNPTTWFRDYDRLHRGYVTKRQFRSVLNNTGLPITSAELDLLYKRFHRDSNGHIRYRPICDAIESSQKVTAASAASATTLAPVPAPARPGPDGRHVMRRIQTVVHRRRVRLEAYFVDFDALRTGCVSPDEFRRTLDRYDIALTDQEFAVLLDRYTSDDPKRTGRVNYARFCRDVGAAFVPVGIEQHPTGFGKAPLVLFDPDEERVDLIATPGENKAIDALLDRMRTVVAERGLNLKPYLEDYDRSNDGVVSREQFHAAINTWADPVTSAQVALLHKRFHRGDAIDYVRFVNAVEQQHKPDESSSSSIAKSLTPVKKPVPHVAVRVADVLRRLKIAGSKFEMRPKDVFEPYDGLRSGHVSPAIFRRCLDVCNFRLSDAEFAALVDTYRNNKTGAVCYARFCVDFDAEPTAPLTATTELLSTSSEMALVNGALRRVAGVIVKRRVQSIRESFAAFDKPRRGRVQRMHLASVLLDFGGTTNPATIDAICKRYRMEDGDDVDYARFCADLDAVVDDLLRRRH
ncbi:EF-hand domain-containing protein [Plasmodiophora brassicae]